MDADVWSKHREERQKARLRDRGGMWKPVTPGRMAHDLLSKYRPRPPQESPTRPRKSAGARKSVGAGILPSRKSVGRKSVGAPRKSAAAADDDGDVHAAPKKAKPKAKAATKAKKLAIEPVKLANAQAADDLALAKPKSSKGKPSQAQPLFMTASEPAPAPVKPPKKPVHPALSGALLLNQPPPPPRPPPQPEPSKKRPADAYAPTSEASEFVPSSPPPAKRARTKRRALADVPEEEEGEEIDLRLADDVRSDDEADEPKRKVVKIVKKKTKDAPAKAKPKSRAKKGAVVDDEGDDEPVASGSKTKAKGAKKGDSAVVPSTSKTKAKSKAKVKQTSEELDAHEDDGSVSAKAKAKTVKDGSSKRATSKPAVSGAEDDDAEKLSSAKGRPADESTSSISKRAKADKIAPPDDDSKSASKRKAKTKPDDDPKPKPPPRKRKAADEENAAPRKRKRLPSPPPAEQKPLRPAVTPHTRRRRIEAVLATEDSPVKTMHRQYDGLPDPIDCFL